MKTEAERRFERFRATVLKNPAFTPLDLEYERALFSAIFDPLPPEPEPVKTLGEVARYAYDCAGGSVVEIFDRVALQVVTAHEARRPKPTVEQVARTLYEATRDDPPWDRYGETGKSLYRAEALAVFPLFGVTP